MHAGLFYSISRSSYVFVGCDRSNGCDEHFVSLAAYLVQSSTQPFISDLGVRLLGITCSVENNVKDINP